MTAWSQRSSSFDRPVRTWDVLKFQVVPSPGQLAPVRSKIGTCEQEQKCKDYDNSGRTFLFLVCQQILGNLFISACGFCSVIIARDISLAVVITAIGSYRSEWDNSQEIFIVFVTLTDMRPASHSLWPHSHLYGKYWIWRAAKECYKNAC